MAEGMTIIDCPPGSACSVMESVMDADYCLLVVDGRQQGYSLGLSMKELAAFMADLGCKAAYNLDGGISAQIAYMGERINHPGKDRNLRDVILLLEPESTPTPAE